MAAKSTKEPKTMEELLARHIPKYKSFKRLEVIDATLKSIGRKQATFDVGGKGDAVCEGDSFVEAKAFIKKMKPGDIAKALVLDPETPEGMVLLSFRHAAAEAFWKKMEKAYKGGDAIEVTGKTATSHGMMVSIGNESAFIPSSQFSSQAPDNLEELVDEKIKVKIIDFDRKNGRIVLSERAVSEAADIARLEAAIKAAKIGEVYEGQVTTVVSFGAFVEIEVKVGKEMTSVEGLVHVSEMSWGKVDTPEDVVREGDDVNVKVIGVERGKLAMSIRQAQDDPWNKVAKKYKADDKVTGKIVRISDFGAFVQLEDGVEGLIHMTKIPPGTALKPGQSVNCYVEDVDQNARKISLGIVLTTSKPVGYR